MIMWKLTMLYNDEYLWYLYFTRVLRFKENSKYTSAILFILQSHIESNLFNSKSLDFTSSPKYERRVHGSETINPISFIINVKKKRHKKKIDHHCCRNKKQTRSPLLYCYIHTVPIRSVVSCNIKSLVCEISFKELLPANLRCAYAD